VKQRILFYAKWIVCAIVSWVAKIYLGRWLHVEPGSGRDYLMYYALVGVLGYYVAVKPYYRFVMSEHNHDDK